MNKFCLLLFVATWFSNAQQISVRGILKDSQTKVAVISASIGVKNTASGTISNEEGEFQLSVSGSAEVIISCLGYQAISLPASGFGSETKTIFLEPSEEILEEVMVTKIPLHEILKNVIYTSAKRLNKPILLHTYYREFSKTNGKYNRFADGLLDYHIGGNAKKTTSELTVPQNRSFNLLTPKEEEESIAGSFINVQDAVSKNYSLNYLYENFVKGKNFQKYEFTLRSKKDAAGSEIHSISFEPKAEVEKSLFAGTVIYDPQSNLILEAEVFLDPSHLQYMRIVNVLIAKVTILDSKMKTAYKVSGGNYVLSHATRYNKFKVFNKKFNEILESKSDLIVTDFENGVASAEKGQRFKKKHLYEKPSQFKDNFWQKSNALILTSEEEKVVRSLEKADVVIPQ